VAAISRGLVMETVAISRVLVTEAVDSQSPENVAAVISHVLATEMVDSQSLETVAAISRILVTEAVDSLENVAVISRILVTVAVAISHISVTATEKAVVLSVVVTS